MVAAEMSGDVGGAGEMPAADAASLPVVFVLHDE
jgi:hypothetical protein